jgi:hypothetical protein
MSSVINQIGFYYFPDDLHYTQADLRAWLPILKQLRANWVTLQAGHDRAIPEEFLRSLIEARIQPIIHIPARVGEINPPASILSWRVIGIGVLKISSSSIDRI